MRARILLNGRRSAAALTVAALLAVSHAAEHVSWRDIESRIQYGYYTEDGTALHALEDTLAANDSGDRLHGYYNALLAWRLAQLTARTPALWHGVSAAQMAERCVTEANTLLAAQADFAEALALRAACRATPTEADASASAYAGRRARHDLERALQLAGRNPRVLLVDALNDYELSSAAGGNKERALVKMRRAVAAFEAERADAERLPGWGAAEAYLLLARSLLDHGEGVGARDALEHALLIAPEFAQARRLMAQITGG
jgi:hypothetical protein